MQNNTQERKAAKYEQHIFYIFDTHEGPEDGSYIAELNQAMEQIMRNREFFTKDTNNIDVKISVLKYDSSVESKNAVETEPLWARDYSLSEYTFFSKWITAQPVDETEFSWPVLTPGVPVSLDTALKELNTQLEQLPKKAQRQRPIIIFTANNSKYIDWSEKSNLVHNMNRFSSVYALVLRGHSDVGVVQLPPHCSMHEALRILSNVDEYCTGRFDTKINRIKNPNWCKSSRPRRMGELIDDYFMDDKVVVPTVEPSGVGKKKCILLKLIRKSIADANDIPLEMTLCTSKEQCSGTCPACDEELRMLNDRLEMRYKSGKKIIHPGSMTNKFYDFLENLTELPENQVALLKIFTRFFVSEEQAQEVCAEWDTSGCVEDAGVRLPVLQIVRLGYNLDGDGITSLVGLDDCPNHCKYCINGSIRRYGEPHELTPAELYDLLSVDDMYFRTTNGGITFGGGEPLLWASAIAEFAQIVRGAWKLNIETCLNAPWENVEMVIPYVDLFIVDIKDMNDEIYQAYTRVSNQQVKQNLKRLAERVPEKILVRVPLIPHYNNPDDVARSKAALLELGITRIDEFTYEEDIERWHALTFT